MKILGELGLPLAFFNQLADEIKPSSVKMKPISGGSHFVGLSLFAEVNSELIQKRSEGLRKGRVSLCNKVTAAAAFAFFGPARRNLTICGLCTFTIIPN